MKSTDRDRRSHSRVRTSTPIRVYSASPDIKVYQDAVLDQISDSGFAFSLASSGVIADQVKIEVVNLGAWDELRFLGTITWREKSQMRFGGRFRGISESQIQALRQTFPELGQTSIETPDRRTDDRRSDVRRLKDNLRSAARVIEDIKRQLKPRVAVTGIGVISPIGIDLQTIWQSMLTGSSAIKEQQLLNESDENPTIAAQVNNFEPKDYLDPKRVRRLHRHSQMACAAAALAMTHASLKNIGTISERCGVFEGTSIGGIETIFEQHRVYISRGSDKVNPLVLLSGSLGDAASEISMLFGMHGPSQTICTGSASSTDAIGLGMRAIQRGDVDIALVGGSETPLTPEMVNTFKKMGVLLTGGNGSSAQMKPFDLNRSGFALGEGAAFLVIEKWESAIQRNVPIHAELTGYGNSCDAYHSSASDPLGRGLALAVNHALSDSSLEKSQIDYVNMHGTATLAGDRGETRGMKKAFGAHVKNMFFSSTKPMTGHLLGASGALEIAIMILSMKNGFVPPTLNLLHPDPECDLNFVPKLIKHPIRNALKMSSGFGGKNAAIILSKVD